ncbi:MAG: hypothetical protein P1V51_17550 [Deltaproteobacteria bacterium]|nr:hypothetical protein [Deltaproteobacteria bacterium]
MRKLAYLLPVALLASTLTACSPAPEGIALARPAATTVKMDFQHRPLPEIPLPNDIATRADLSSATGLRVNASQVAPTAMEIRVRQKVDALDGWGVFQPISIPFTGPLDVRTIVERHRDVHYDLEDDVIYLIDVDPDSAAFGQVHHLDLGNGNYPVVVERQTQYWANDPRAYTLSLGFEEVDEDLNGNGVLDPGEDTDGDGLLDEPNYLPGADPDPTDLAARADALMSFYEKQTDTLIVRPMLPLQERTTYAVVVTRRLLDADGQPVGSPYEWIHHLAQTAALEPLAEALAEAHTFRGAPVDLGIALEDVAYAFTFTTQTVEAGWKAVRDGLYGHGLQAHIGERFPAKIDSLLELRDWDHFPDMEKPHIVHGEQWAEIMRVLGPGVIGMREDSVRYQQMIEGIGYIDYFVIGSFCSPQLYARGGGEPFLGGGCDDAAYDPDGLRADEDYIPDRDWANLNDQAWPEDLDSVPVETRPERVYFTLAVPRKEVSARGEGQPADVIIAGHGYGSNRFEGMQWAAYWARHGQATLSIDGPSHGIGVSDAELSLVRGILGPQGASALIDAIFSDRAWDQDGDGSVDSAADFWTGYLFHTRDVVRQFALDYMQLIRIVRSFDGETTWDVDTDGRPGGELKGLAGDFDGDGEVDIGRGSQLTMIGGSLGGMMSMVMGSVEPELTAVAPLAGGGGVTDLGMRTTQGGAVEGFMLRSMGPFFIANVDLGGGPTRVAQIVPDLNDATTVPIADVVGVSVGDTMVVENLDSGERACGLVAADGGVRAPLAADKDDPIAIRFFAGAVNLPGTECEVPESAELILELSEFEIGGGFQYRSIPAGDPLVALAEGMGLPRAHPDLRRFVGIGQLVLDASDMAVLGRHAQVDPMTYPGTGQTTGSHILQITTQGDTSVAVAGGMSFGRAAGLIEWLEDRPDLGTTENQYLIDTHVAEGVHTIPRHFDGAGRSVHFDVENFSQGTHPWGAATYPTTTTPLHIGLGKTDPLGGKSASFFPLTNPTGAHGFDQPGEMTDDARAACAAACQPDPTACGCDTLWAWDVGNFLVNMAGDYLRHGGKQLKIDHCLVDGSCADALPAPAPRDRAELDE